MCSSCGSKTYGQSQPDARAADKARLDKVEKARQNRSRREKAALN